LGRDRERAVIVLITYLDDSGTDRSSPVATMAGYVGGIEEWEAFEANTATVFES
jgi:hypothetical protein